MDGWLKADSGACWPPPPPWSSRARPFGFLLLALDVQELLAGFCGGFCLSVSGERLSTTHFSAGSTVINGQLNPCLTHRALSTLEPTDMPGLHATNYSSALFLPRSHSLCSASWRPGDWVDRGGVEERPTKGRGGWCGSGCRSAARCWRRRTGRRQNARQDDDDDKHLLTMSSVTTSTPAAQAGRRTGSGRCGWNGSILGSPNPLAGCAPLGGMMGRDRNLGDAANQ